MTHAPAAAAGLLAAAVATALVKADGAATGADHGVNERIGVPWVGMSRAP